MRIPIEDVKVKKRFRKEMGSIEELAASIEYLGLLQPIVISPKNVLIAGERRLRACQSLGWTEIDAHVVDTGLVIAAEYSENEVRKSLTVSELVAIGKAIQKEEKKKATLRSAYHPEPDEDPEKYGTPGRVGDIVERKIGIDRKKFAKAQKVVEAAQDDPDKFGPIQTEMDETGKVYNAYNKLRRLIKKDELKEAAAEAEPSPDCKLIKADNMSALDDGIADLIMTDPPYNISHNRVVEHGDRIETTNDFGEWDHIDHDDYLAMLRSWSKEFFRVLRDGGSVYAFCAEAYVSYFRSALIEAGFRFKNVIVWYRPNAKPKPDKTSFMASCDYIVFAVKGLNHTFNFKSVNEMRNLIECPICHTSKRVGHPTQKPAYLISQLIEISSYPGDLVVDPFAGSGTTGLAAMGLKRRSMLIEKEEEYVVMIEGRLGVKREKSE